MQYCGELPAFKGLHMVKEGMQIFIYPFVIVQMERTVPSIVQTALLPNDSV